MFKTHFLLLAPCLLLPALVAGCSDSADPDTAPPQVTLNATAYSTVQGFYTMPATWSDDVGVIKATLMLDGQPAGEVEVTTKIIDSTTLSPGLHKMSLQVSDAAGNVAKSAELPVICAGQGKVLAYKDVFTAAPAASTTVPGWAGFDLTVPGDAEGALEDAKAHVDVPAGMKKAMVYFRWKGTTAWTLGFDIGTGECPDSGTKLASKDEAGAEGISEVTHSMDAGLTAGQWFGHVRFPEGGNHKNEKLHVESLYLVVP